MSITGRSTQEMVDRYSHYNAALVLTKLKRGQDEAIFILMRELAHFCVDAGTGSAANASRELTASLTAHCAANRAYVDALRAGADLPANVDFSAATGHVDAGSDPSGLQAAFARLTARHNIVVDCLLGRFSRECARFEQRGVSAPTPASSRRLISDTTLRSS